jgi:hypothetical protein
LGFRKRLSQCGKVSPPLFCDLGRISPQRSGSAGAGQMSLIAELKRRNVFRVGVAYAIVAWLLIEVASVLLPTFDAPPLGGSLLNRIMGYRTLPKTQLQLPILWMYPRWVGTKPSGSGRPPP